MSTSATSGTPAPTPGSPSPVGSVDKALALLEVLAEAGPEGRSLRDIAAAAGLNKASVHRLLRALLHRGFAEQSPTDQRYRLGASALELARSFGGGEELPARFAPALASISQQTEELVHLGQLDGPRVLYLDKVEPERTLRVWSRVGRRAPAARTAMGRALLAADGIRAEALSAFAAATGAAGTGTAGTGAAGAGAVWTGAPETGNAQAGAVLSPARLSAVVEQAALQGWAEEVEENEAGIACVGVALVRPVGRSVAVSVTGPLERLGQARRAQIGELLRETLARLAPEEFTVAPRE